MNIIEPVRILVKVELAKEIAGADFVILEGASSIRTTFHNRLRTCCFKTVVELPFARFPNFYVLTISKENGSHLLITTSRPSHEEIMSMSYNPLKNIALCLFRSLIEEVAKDFGLYGGAGNALTPKGDIYSCLRCRSVILATLADQHALLGLINS